MKGNNQIIFCEAAMMDIIQKYMDDIMSYKSAPIVNGVAYDSAKRNFTVNLSERKKEKTDE